MREREETSPPHGCAVIYLDESTYISHLLDHVWQVPQAGLHGLALGLDVLYHLSGGDVITYHLARPRT